MNVQFMLLALATLSGCSVTTSKEALKRADKACETYGGWVRLEFEPLLGGVRALCANGEYHLL